MGGLTVGALSLLSDPPVTLKWCASHPLSGGQKVIHTGECPVSAAATEALEAAVERACLRGSRYATCDDLMGALVAMRDGEVATALRLLRRPAMPSRLPLAGALSGPAPETGRTVDPRAVRANRPLQQAIELAADGAAITTGSLLLGLMRAERSSIAHRLLQAGIGEADVVRALGQCASEMATRRRPGGFG